MKSLFLLIAGLMLSTLSLADDIPPDVLIKNVTNEVLEIVRKDKEIQSGNTKKATELIELKVLPNFNFTRMTQKALGSNWIKANATQQKQLTDELRTLLVRIYSTTLTQYKDQEISFREFVLKPGETEVKVRTVIKQKNGAAPIPVDYWLEKSATGWKAVDIDVSGVSLLANYKGEFVSVVRNDGFDGLIKYLQAKNKTGETAPTKK